MLPSNTIWAKKIRTASGVVLQSLAGHIGDCLTSLYHLLLPRHLLLNRLCRHWGFKVEDYYHLLYTAVFAHDLGKATKEFQERLLQCDLSRELSHTFFSLPLGHNNLPYPLNLLCRTLILTHHTQPFEQLYYSFYLLPRVSYLESELAEFINFNYPLFYRSFSSFFQLRYRLCLSFEPMRQKQYRREALLQQLSELQQQLHAYPFSLALKAAYALAITLLKFSDAIASINFSRQASETTPKGKVGLHETITEPHSTILPALPLLPWQLPPQDRGWDALRQEICQQGALRIIWLIPERETGTVIKEMLLSAGIPPSVIAIAPTLNSSSVVQWENNKLALLKPFTTTHVILPAKELIRALVHGHWQADYVLGLVLESMVIITPSTLTADIPCLKEALSLLVGMGVPCYISNPSSLSFSPFLPQPLNQVFSSPFYRLFQATLFFGPAPWEVEEELNQLSR